MLQILPIVGLPEFRPGDDPGQIIARRLASADPGLSSGDILVVAQKIVSKADGRFVKLADVSPSQRARELAAHTGKDAALVELILSESTAVVRSAPNILITRHRSGHVMANAGIDASNIGPNRSGSVLLLPLDADASAKAIREAVARSSGIAPGVVISDSFGRPWRMGTVNVAIGLCDLPAVEDRRGDPDRDGRIMQVTQVAVADAIAAAAGLVMGEATEGVPACILRGWTPCPVARSSAALVRPLTVDLFA